MIFEIDDLENTFITADHHFGHANIIQFCNRPFASIEEMDTTLIANWNKIVKPNNTVYHLGDFTLGDIDEAKKYLSQLNGKIKILANEWHHDRRWLAGFDTIAHMVNILSPMVVLEVLSLGKNGHPLAITLCHYPLAVWDRKHYGSWHLHGHCHGNCQYSADDYAIDIGVDCMNFYPISLANVLTLMYERGYI